MLNQIINGDALTATAPDNGEKEIKCILRYPGAKWSIAPWIIDKMPKHHSYLEPYIGSGDVINLFRVIRTNTEALYMATAATPYSRQEYEEVFELPETDNSVEKARRFLIKSWQGHGFRTYGKTGRLLKL